MALKLYHAPETRSMRSLWLLHELGVPFELITMPFEHTYLRTPEYRKIHPLGRVPALVDGDMTLLESGAIAEYLCERYDPGHRMGRPLGHPERYAFLQWIHFAETVIIPCQNMVQQYVFTPAEHRAEMVLYFETRRLGKCLDMIEKQLGAGEYLLPSGFSAADVGVGFSVYFAGAFVSFAGHPKVAAYRDRLMARPAFQRALPPDRKPLEWFIPKLGPVRDPNTGQPV
ncbi:MAG: glutathione S-transferase family protein [Rhodospirillaceae bacterium]|nr:glutathione S-transferase family protein [Rhodospirillaceae bacterium]